MMNYQDCEKFFAKRKDKSATERRYSHNQWIGYDAESGVYHHRHHNTHTVYIHPNDTYQIFTGGWDTNTTWAKIREFVNLWWVHPIPPSVVERKWLSMQDGSGITPFYEGIRVTRSGLVVSERVPYHKLVLNEGAMDEFNIGARLVREKCRQSLWLAAMLLKPSEPRPECTPKQLWDIMVEVVDHPEGVPENALFLYVQREPVYFRTYRRNPELPTRTPAQCLESSIAAARRYYVEHEGYTLYDSVEFTEPVTSFKRKAKATK